MKNTNYGYVNVDELIQQTPLAVVLNHYGLPQPESSTAEYRLNCVFNETCHEKQYGNLSIAADSFKRIFSHCCGVRGNLLTLIHGLENRTPPTGGKLRGQEFKDAVSKLREITGGASGAAIATDPSPPLVVKPQTNTPLHRHEKEAAQKLADLYEDLIVDPAQMCPAAAVYVRSRPWLTPKLMQQWGVGWIEGSGRSLFRSKYLVYTHRNARDEVVSYSGRDLSFEEKWLKWLRHRQPQDEARKPNKHRYVKGYQRGLELYGGHASRLSESYVRESLKARGLVVAEGMNEVLRMASLNVCAVGLGSNTATDTQVQTIIRNARQAAHGKVLLLPDCDEEGESGFRELLWKLSQAGLTVRLACSSQMFDARYAGRQPESFTDDEWREIDQAGLVAKH